MTRPSRAASPKKGGRAVCAVLCALGFVACTAEPSCLDAIGRPCTSNLDCAVGDACKELVGRGFFCVPPDGSGTRVVGGALRMAPISEGRTEGGFVVRAGGVRSLPASAGKVGPDDAPTFVVDGELR